MWHLLKRHPFAVAAHLRRCLALTFAFPSEVLTPLLPPGLALDSYGDFGFVAIAMVETQRLRPAFLAPAFGQNFYLCGYRLFTRLAAATSAFRGLYILRSDTDRQVMVALGNLFTHYRYELCQARISYAEGGMRWAIATRDGTADLDVEMHRHGTDVPLPDGSPFPDSKTARRFAGPLPYTFDYERETGKIVVVKGNRANWNPEPAQVEVAFARFFDDPRFGRVMPRLANAFYVEHVDYRWDRGHLAQTR